jgi:catechol 2,3-dioxygenase-like lactoylglutathione lyase family enzyme
MAESKGRWTSGAHHVGLTVPDLGAAVRFFQDGLGYEQIGEVPDYPAAFLSDGAMMITLWQADNAAEAVPFDRRRNLGLHHLAITVGEAGIDALHKRLASRDDIEIEFAPERLGAGPTRHMMIRIPGQIRVELIAPARG